MYDPPQLPLLEHLCYALHMAKKRPHDYHDTVYHFICNHVQATGEFPPTYFIARRMNLQYRTVYDCLNGLESRGLIERRTGKRVAGIVQCEKRVPALQRRNRPLRGK